ncbi:MAG: hypothetical protein A2315_11415 [Ignavibacteria bacterium RIFOXYB2_FULL_35_12]|nr:MAG: hypothetical protein A2006_04080 [Ignavibacteria bacterium GWC2_35_8]OGU58098.1 MAG: hypothetical protein A2X60_03305 [Ignavibacteria bacterium GWF2_35_20]OGU80016.1 MAG: hypothetical protein A2254_16815 [Ignavibacteria bacterium RIFOXYA2_FULL_35_9]OGU87564.1 MAG: hypothetical protein A2492_08100 [Ignavibacteria bacterium RIFOXYC12_FULL_35_11]OGU90209.1 MAG: hypothetical protein A3K31_10340 [Ignavibacteria bacterium RIFOXYA12_FULL_35_25]OGU94039.1 MAG: hypothetical protein A2347_11255 
MSIIPKSIKSILLLDALLYLCGAVGIYLISLKTDLPFQTTFNESIITIIKLSDGSTYNLEGQRIRSINGYVFRSPEETETYLDGLGVGDKIKLVIDNQNVVEVKLVNYYSTVYLLLSYP